MSSAIIRCTIFAAAMVAAPAAAADPGQSTNPDITVFAARPVADRYVIEIPVADLDLSRPSDIVRLRTRVGLAARQGCAIRLYDPPLTANEHRGCVEDAVGGAASQLRRAERRALEIARTGRSSIPPVVIALSTGF